MSTVLVITANPKASEQSYSLSAAHAFMEEYRISHPNDELVLLDLYQEDLPLLDETGLSAYSKYMATKSFDGMTIEERAHLERAFQFTEQFIQADKYVFVNPMWNFSIPPKLRAYIDLIVIAGKTFIYDREVGLKSLIPGKKALHIQASGSVFSEGPMQEMEFAARYIKSLFHLFGFEADYLNIEGTAMDKDGSLRRRSMERARQLAASF